MNASCHWLCVRHLYLAKKLFYWWGTYRTDMLHGIILSYCIKKQILKIKRNLKIDSNSKPYLEKPINYNASWFLRMISKFWVSPLFRKLMEFPMSLIFRVPPIWLQLSPNPKVENLCHSVQIRNSSSTPTCRDHNFWTIGRMRVYLYFLEGYQNCLPLLYCSFLLFLHQIQSARFYEIVVSPNQNLYSRFFHLCIVFQWS
jgi:hypothetical protein